MFFLVSAQVGDVYSAALWCMLLCACRVGRPILQSVVRVAMCPTTHVSGDCSM